MEAWKKMSAPRSYDNNSMRQKRYNTILLSKHACTTDLKQKPYHIMQTPPGNVVGKRV